MLGTVGSLIGFLLILLVLGVLWWIVKDKLLPMLPVAEPFSTLIQIVLVLILLFIVVWAIIWVVGLAGIHVPTPFR